MSEGARRSFPLELVVKITGMVVLMFAVQSMFDASDRNKAVALVAELAPGRPDVMGALKQEAGGGSPLCQAHILSSCAGKIEVICSAGKSEPYRFGVDLVRKTVRPLDPRTEQLLASAPRVSPPRPAPPSAPPAAKPSVQ